jgi:S-DNA-T family DNA segregation ATPase FtsK/SpoIIIE
MPGEGCPGGAQRRVRASDASAPSHDTPTVPQALPLIIQTAPPPPKPSGPLVIPALLGDDGTKHEYVLPPFELLKESPPPPVHHESAAREKQAVLMQTLNDFKIGANVAQVAMGPTVTRYEVQLEPGILVKKIVALADNLAMSLAAIDVRVEAPIPGKAAIGIEVPNDVTQMVSLRECLETNEFMNAPSKLTFALGKDVSGEYKYADLTRMPHLLVGGSTNSGKSVCLNTIISSILYRATPREVKFVMIDPKRVELSLYDGIPHLLAPVVKNVKQAAGIFRSCLKEMEDRYDAFARLGTRNIEGYNSRVAPDERLPFIVLVVDELADLMMQQGPEVETSICRLAQLARATGIHLVIATQRPSVDVITGTIKANISSRIAFAVATQVDSRTIIDMPGADRLIGRGDMLFMPIDAAKPIRVQGCYIGERETEGLATYLKEQEEVHYTMIPSEAGDGTMGNAGGEDDGSSDEIFEPAVRWLVMQGQCSTSSIQRKFKIGYTRSARLVEFMEAQGIVGSQDGIKPREVLLRPENVDVWFAGQGQGDLGQG